MNLAQANKEHRRITLKDNRSRIKKKLNAGNLAKIVLPKVATAFFNFVRIGPRVILRSTFQILRTNIWTRLISTLLIVSIDFYSFFRKRISKKQLVINLILSATLLVGGTLGWFFGTNSVLTIVAENTILWIAAGIAGAGILSSILETLCKKILGRFISSDMEDVIDIINEEFECIVTEKELNEEQANLIAKTVHICEKTCLNCFRKSDKQKYAREILEPYFE